MPRISTLAAEGPEDESQGPGQSPINFAILCI